MPLQRTFTVIPTGPNAPPAQYVRPMTTKQVRKAYKASTKTPPMSRAERQKQDRAEQERIRKEFEKEKVAAKARLAREKKRDKELAEREQKKKLRMPLVNVRPSQDTIARFVRGNGSGRKRSAGGEALEEKHGVEVEKCEGVGDGDGEGEGGGRNGGRELDLIPEEDESDLEELLDTIANDVPGLVPQNDTRNEPDPPAENHQPKQQEAEQHEAEQQEHIQPPPQNEPSSQPQIPQPNNEDMKPPSRPHQPNPQPSRQISSPPPIIHPAPMSTQAILGNLADFFPTSSQQALELRDETFDDILNDSYEDIMDTPTPTPQKDLEQEQVQAQAQQKLMPPPKRFFTSSGSKELISLAIQRSKRTAALEELQDEEVHAQNYKKEIHASKQCTLPLDHGGVAKISQPQEDKENIPVKNTSQLCDISDSQETEYGGDWVDELALDLIV